MMRRSDRAPRPPVTIQYIPVKGNTWPYIHHILRHRGEAEGSRYICGDAIKGAGKGDYHPDSKIAGFLRQPRNVHNGKPMNSNH
jgi:hypothetical protein